jgi:hypothetical protein
VARRIDWFGLGDPVSSSNDRRGERGNKFSFARRPIEQMKFDLTWVSLAGLGPH